MLKRVASLGVLILSAVLLAGCYGDYGPVAADPAPIPPPAMASSLQVGDQVTLSVYGEPNLSGVYSVNPGGFLDLPLIGAVRAVGYTPTELSRVIETRYSEGNFLQQAHATVVVTQYQPIYIFGEVVKPGQYPYQTGLNVLTAITTAGGLTYRGSRDDVLIERAGQQVWNKYPLQSSVTVLPGDVIRVPERYF
jgi:protein involved in polysaccharide export with SLBB domain